MLKPYSFCIFARDKSGKVNNRCFCEIHKNIIYLFSFHGSDIHLYEVFESVLKKKTNLPVLKKGSWL